MMLIRFTDAQLHELMQAARMVPPIYVMSSSSGWWSSYKAVMVWCIA